MNAKLLDWMPQVVYVPAAKPLGQQPTGSVEPANVDNVPMLDKIEGQGAYVPIRQPSLPTAVKATVT